MLGWLARWLRIIGVDARYGDRPDDELAETPCLLVTRDRELFRRRRGPAVLLLTEDHVAWISALIRALGVEPFRRTRCPKCNAELVEIPCAEAERRVGHPVRSPEMLGLPQLRLYILGRLALARHQESGRRGAQEARGLPGDPLATDMPEEAQPPTTPSAGDPRGKIGRTTTIEPMAPGGGINW
jgi:Uncharacterized conserved protein